MKKQAKRVFGLCGLAVVGVTTAIAASLPAPITAATEGGNTSATDTVIVRVVSNTPDVNVGGVINDDTIIRSKQTLTVDYSEGVKTLTAKLVYTDFSGETATYVFGTIDIDYQSGTWTLPVDLSELIGVESTALGVEGYANEEERVVALGQDNKRFGYGHYEFIAEGVGHNGVVDTDALEFDYVAAIAKDGGTDESGNQVIDIDSDGKYATEVNVYDGDTLVPCASVVVGIGTSRVTLPFAECGMHSGTYKIVINSIDANGKVVSTYSFTIDYTAPGETPVPDTGSITANLNISRTDYIVTGLIIFGMMAIFGIAMIVKRKKSHK